MEERRDESVCVYFFFAVATSDGVLYKNIYL